MKRKYLFAISTLPWHQNLKTYKTPHPRRASPGNPPPPPPRAKHRNCPHLPSAPNTGTSPPPHQQPVFALFESFRSIVTYSCSESPVPVPMRMFRSGSSGDWTKSTPSIWTGRWVQSTCREWSDTVARRGWAFGSVDCSMHKQNRGNTP